MDRLCLPGPRAPQHLQDRRRDLVSTDSSAFDFFGTDSFGDVSGGDFGGGDF
jgi:hypothetical protein